MLVVWTLGSLRANDASSGFFFEGRSEMQFPFDHHASRRDISNKAKGETRRVSRALLLPWVLGPNLSVSPNGTTLMAQATFFTAFHVCVYGRATLLRSRAVRVLSRLRLGRSLALPVWIRTWNREML